MSKGIGQMLPLTVLISLLFVSESFALTSLNVESSRTDLVLGDQVKITVRLSSDLEKPVLIRPNYEWNSPLLECKSCEARSLQFASQALEFEWVCENAGSMVVYFNALEVSLVTSNSSQNQTNSFKSNLVQLSSNVETVGAFVQLNIGRSAFLYTLSWAFGWCYFLSWILSMYPQCIVNYRRKSVIGLNFDYVALCLVGYISYAIFNVCFTWIPLFRNSFETKHPHSNIPVQINDVLFSLHGVAATAVLAIQCAIYERGDQRICQKVHAILISVYSPSIVLSIMLLCSQLEPLSYIYFFSYVKMCLTIAKYIPQVVFNYRRKSTAGWSIHNIILDFNGGILSIGQMACLAINFDDPNYFTCNVAKLGIGLVTLFFDSIFIVQHYCLYSDRHALDNDDQKSQSSADGSDAESRLTVVTTHGSSIRHSPKALTCRGCCSCLAAKTSSIGRALNGNFNESNEFINSMVINKHLQLKASEKET